MADAAAPPWPTLGHHVAALMDPSTDKPIICVHCESVDDWVGFTEGSADVRNALDGKPTYEFEPPEEDVVVRRCRGTGHPRSGGFLALTTHGGMMGIGMGTSIVKRERACRAALMATMAVMKGGRSPWMPTEFDELIDMASTVPRAASQAGVSSAPSAPPSLPEAFSASSYAPPISKSPPMPPPLRRTWVLWTTELGRIPRGAWVATVATCRSPSEVQSLAEDGNHDDTFAGAPGATGASEATTGATGLGVARHREAQPHQQTLLARGRGRATAREAREKGGRPERAVAT